MSSTTCTSLPQLEKVRTVAGTTQRSRAQVHPPTTPCAVDALLQYSARELTSCVLHREQWRMGTATVGGGAGGVSDNAATDGGIVVVIVVLAEASVGGGSVTGAASGGGRDAQSWCNDVMAEPQLVGGAALRITGDQIFPDSPVV